MGLFDTDDEGFRHVRDVRKDKVGLSFPHFADRCIDREAGVVLYVYHEDGDCAMTAVPLSQTTLDADGTPESDDD